MVFEGVPGGPMDCWEDVRSPTEHLARSLSILEEHLPWEAERCRGVELTDPNGVLTGRFAPTVRHPVAVLPGRGAHPRYGRRRRPQRPDHRSGVEQRREVRGYLSRVDPRARRRALRPCVDAGDVRPVLAGLRPVGDGLDERAARVHRSRTCSNCSMPPRSFLRLRRRSRTGSTTPAPSIRGGSTTPRRVA